jgi:membrane protease YdiL (CAAX protease family)
MAENITKEWDDSKDMLTVQYLFMLFLALALSWGITIFSQLGDTATANVLWIFVLLLIFTFIIAIANDFTPAGKYLFGFGGFNNSEKTVIAFLASLVIGIGLISQHMTIATLSISAGGGIGVFTVVVVAGIVEELFFRCALFWTLAKVLGGGWFGAVASSLMTSATFAFFHYFSYGANVGMMVSAFIFSMIGIFGNMYLRSSGFSMGLHILNNGIMAGV